MRLNFMMLQGKLSEGYYCYECLSPIDDATKYVVITKELIEESGDVLCEVCYTPELLKDLQTQE